MARTRLLHPDAPCDEDIASLMPCARLVWAYLPCHADRAGRLADKPFKLKLAILPTDDVDMDRILDELAARGLITRYEAGGRRFIAIRSFLRYQRPHTNEPESDIPPPPVIAEAPTKVDSAAVHGGQRTALSDPVSDPVSEIDPVKRTRAVARPPANLFDSTLTELASAWSAQYGSPYRPTPADRSQLGRLLSGLAPSEAAELPTLYRRYLADTDTFVADKQRHSVAFFCTSGGMNKYRTTTKSAALSERDKRNVTALAAFGAALVGGPK